MMTWSTVLSIALPVLLGAIVWFFQSLVQRSWEHYEHKRIAYLEVVCLLDSLFEKGEKTERHEYMRAVRKVWLVGSDDVVRAIKELHENIKDPNGGKQREAKYSLLIKSMRDDLHLRHYFPPSKTSVSVDFFPIEHAGK